MGGSELTAHSGGSYYALSSIILGALFPAFPISAASAQSDKDDDVHISDVAEFYAIHKYPGLKAHKAIAVGPGGYWSDYHDANTAAAASKGALNACNGVLRIDKSKKLNSRKCVLFDVDGKRTRKATPIDIPFGTAAEGEDLPWQFGKEWNATTFLAARPSPGRRRPRVVTCRLGSQSSLRAGQSRKCGAPCRP
jgi:hypothetical protein